MSGNSQILLKSTPTGVPEERHFEMVSSDMPTLEDGSVLVQNHWLSLDPYMRGQIAGRHLSGAVLPGDVIKSR